MPLAYNNLLPTAAAFLSPPFRAGHSNAILRQIPFATLLRVFLLSPQSAYAFEQWADCAAFASIARSP